MHDLLAPVYYDAARLGMSPVEVNACELWEIGNALYHGRGKSDGRDLIEARMAKAAESGGQLGWSLPVRGSG